MSEETFQDRLERCTYIDEVTGKRKIKDWLHEKVYEVVQTLNDNYKGNTNSRRTPCRCINSQTGQVHEFDSIKALREFLDAPPGAVRYTLDTPGTLCRGWRLERVKNKKTNKDKNE